MGLISVPAGGVGATDVFARKRSANVAAAEGFGFGFVCAKVQRQQQQMFFARKRSANVAAAAGFCLCESAATATAGCWSRRRYHRR
ncbi:hypothetical protein ABNX05_05340 [Lysinibacillus sp. M3]|uniref:Uncharacterized protein n=1 Tax=Lysinibacillus zambalensis TaxID=3160866 RepID=A0ABV1MPI7_9BACI